MSLAAARLEQIIAGLTDRATMLLASSPSPAEDTLEGVGARSLFTAIAAVPAGLDDGAIEALLIGFELGQVEAITTQLISGEIEKIARGNLRREMQHESAVKTNMNRAGWHEYAFILLAAQMRADATMPRKKLYGWATECVNRRQAELGRPAITDGAVEQAVRRKAKLFQAIQAQDAAQAELDARAPPPDPAIIEKVRELLVAMRQD